MTNTIRALLDSAKANLHHFSDSSVLDAELLMMTAIDCQRSYLYSWPERQLTKPQSQCFNAFIKRRVAGEPVAYIIGNQGFWGLQLDVTNDTLIPRPETELLVETALRLPLVDNAKVLDLGTGSGAIALALAVERPDWQITATDVSAEALTVAISNAQKLNLQQVTFIQSHWFQKLPVASFDLIISNPPYIDKRDACLAALQFEPESALVADNMGLADLQVIIEQAPAYLKNKGTLLLEHGCDQQAILRDLLQKNGFHNLMLLNDLNKLPRVSGGNRNN